MLNRLLGLEVAIRAEVANRLRIAGNAGPHAQHEPALHQVIDHGDLRRRHRRVIVGQRQHAGTEGDRWAGIGEARDESEARSDRLGRVHEMLVDEGLAIAEPISEHDRFTVLAENVCIRARRRVDGLDEESELERALHGGLLVRRHHRTEITKRKPPPALPTGAWVYVLFQALAGAVLPDNDDCDATLFQSATSHEADANTRYSSKQGHECSRRYSGTARVSRFIVDQSCGPTIE
ncbi:MAG TPA: hypothetical protein VEG60_23285 [Candidatus Binatia bacterium]|nr:hypothetical protein [Candidatus Binatia bacterium]